jgi:hypothetical protein
MPIRLTKLHPLTLPSRHAREDMASDDIRWVKGARSRLGSVLVDHPAVFEADALVYADAIVGEELVGAAASVDGEEGGGEESEEGEGEFHLRM